jgi:Zn-dependent protease
MFIVGLIAFLFLISYVMAGPGALLGDLFEILIMVPIILISLTFHEFCHAVMADFLGDPTPRRQGRLSLNPLRHLDLVGTIMLFFARFGWAKPVQVDPSNFRKPHRAMMSVALAGPLSNVFLALLGGLIVKTTYLLGSSFDLPRTLLILILTSANLFIIINVGLTMFNLLPIPPLDGSRVVTYFLPARWRFHYRTLEETGPMLLMILFAFGMLGRILGPLVTWGHRTILTLYGIG